MNFEIIDAFVDGERVDASELKRVLADDAGRDYLVDAWLLREGVQEEMAQDVAPPIARQRAGRPWAMAAAIAAALIGGYFVGYKIGGSMMPVTPVNSQQTAAPASSVTPASFPVPAPTRVIRMEFDTTVATGRGGD